jgi:choline-glycine betaine transporter
LLSQLFTQLLQHLQQLGIQCGATLFRAVCIIIVISSFNDLVQDKADAVWVINKARYRFWLSEVSHTDQYL